MCPQCGSAAAVHSIEELAALAKAQLGEPQQGYAAQPQQGPVPGWAAEPVSGPLPGPRGWQGRVPSRSDSLDGDNLGADLASAAVTAAARFMGRSIGRRVQRAYSEQVLPALAAKREAVLREQIAIARRHPDLRACLTDKVIFLAGGSRVLPLTSVTATLTLEQSDALVAQLRDG